MRVFGAQTSVVELIRVSLGWWMITKKQKAVFLDRDGVINKLIIRNGKAQAPYSLDEFELFPGVEDACARLKAAGYLLVVVTNQPDVARGWVNLESVELVNNQVRALLPVDDIKVCLHTNDHNCDCRKPLPGMLLESAEERNIDLTQSFMVGDRFGDIAAGKGAGCCTILVGPGDQQGDHPSPHHRAISLYEALSFILK
jgi:D-glycero-D-manno-heptose 1,7-bisphosphate phosphatase